MVLGLWLLVPCYYSLCHYTVIEANKIILEVFVITTQLSRSSNTMHALELISNVYFRVFVYLNISFTRVHALYFVLVLLLPYLLI